MENVVNSVVTYVIVILLVIVFFRSTGTKSYVNGIIVFRGAGECD